MNIDDNLSFQFSILTFAFVIVIITFLFKYFHFSILSFTFVIILITSLFIFQLDVYFFYCNNNLSFQVFSFFKCLLYYCNRIIYQKEENNSVRLPNKSQTPSMHQSKKFTTKTTFIRIQYF